MKHTRLLPLILSLLMLLSCLPVPASAESFALPKKMIDSKGNTLCTYQISGKTLKVQTSTDQWIWPFSVSGNIQNQNLILAVRHCFTGAAEGITELVLNPLVESGTVNTIEIHGSYYDSYEKKNISLKDSYQFQRNNKEQVVQCRHEGINFTIQYDSRDRLTSISGTEHPEDFSPAYDQPMKNEIKISYQPNGTLKKIVINNWNEGAEVHPQLNSKGQLTRLNNPSMHGDPTRYNTYTYKNGKLTRDTTKSSSGIVLEDCKLSYDQQGRLSTITYDDQDSVKLIY